jgi:hypothetical protein
MITDSKVYKKLKRLANGATLATKNKDKASDSAETFQERSS